MSPRDRCVDRSWQRDEPVAATASTVRRWLLVEQPGPWGVDALHESPLPATVAELLAEAAHRHRTRVLLVRRPDQAMAGERRVVLADSDPAAPVAWQTTVASPDELLDLQLDAGLVPGATAVLDPLVLVCTNGRHDACCAEFGRPLARALEDELGAWVWEVSHIGGDRFAPNVLTLPYGLYHGRVPTDRVHAFGQAVRHDRVWLPGYRGRSVWPFPVQAAEVGLREQAGMTGIDDIQVLRWGRRGDRTEVLLSAGGDERTVVVATHRDERAWRLTCRAERDRQPPVHEVVSIA